MIIQPQRTLGTCPGALSVSIVESANSIGYFVSFSDQHITSTLCATICYKIKLHLQSSVATCRPEAFLIWRMFLDVGIKEE